MISQLWTDPIIVCAVSITLFMIGIPIYGEIEKTNLFKKLISFIPKFEVKK